MPRVETNYTKIPFNLTREADDPIALRASIGKPLDPNYPGYYLVYRGDPMEVLEMLRTVLAVAERLMPHEPKRPVAS